MTAPSPPRRAVLAGFFLLGLVVYGATLAQRDVWAEECFLANWRPWEVFATFLSMDRWAGRLPVYFLVRSLFIEVLGVNQWGLRLPSLLFGAASIPALYAVVRRAMDERAAVVAAVGLCLAALPGYHARESLAYSLSVLEAVGLFGAGLALAQGRAVGWKAHALSAVSLGSSLMLFPLVGAFSVLGVSLRWREGREAGLRFAKGQAAAWLGAGLVYGSAFLSLQSQGSGLLSMGGEDGDGAPFHENDVLPALVRAIDGLVFGPNGPLVGSPPSVWFAISAAACVLALCWSRRGRWAVGVLTVVGYLGALVPFWILSDVFGHDHRLDTRYFVHLAPAVLFGWVAALQALPRGVRPVGEAALLVLLGWGTLRSQVPPNRTISELRETIEARALPGDRGAGPEAYFDAGVTCLDPIALPRIEPDEPPAGLERLWIVREKDDADRFPPEARHALPPELDGFALAFEDFLRPEHHEEFGQIVLLTRYDRGAIRPEAQDVDLRVDLSGWPVSGSVRGVTLYRLAEFPLRYRDGDAEVVAELPVRREGDVWVATARLEPDVVYDWDVNVWSVPLPGLGPWPAGLPQVPFTLHGVDAGRPSVTARPPAHWDPALTVAALVAMALLMALSSGGVIRGLIVQGSGSRSPRSE